MRPLLLATLLLLVSTHAVQAEPRDRSEKHNGPRPHERAPRASTLTANEAAARVQARTGGRVLSVTSSGGGYRVKVLNPRAQVRIYTVNATTGAIE